MYICVDWQRHYVYGAHVQAAPWGIVSLHLINFHLDPQYMTTISLKNRHETIGVKESFNAHICGF
jgi:hypothetical protein